MYYIESNPLWIIHVKDNLPIAALDDVHPERSIRIGHITACGDNKVRIYRTQYLIC